MEEDTEVSVDYFSQTIMDLPFLLSPCKENRW